MDPLNPTGTPAPPFDLPDLDGRVHSLAQARGRIVILNFWSAECPWSARADQALVETAAGWGERALVWSIASNANESLDLVRQAAADRHLPVVLLDTHQAVADLYGAQTTPHLFLVDAGGVLCYQGAFDDVTFRQRVPRRAYLLEAVEALLSGRLPDPAQTPPYGCTITRFAGGES